MCCFYWFIIFFPVFNKNEERNSPIGAPANILPLQPDTITMDSLDRKRPCPDLYMYVFVQSKI